MFFLSGFFHIIKMQIQVRADYQFVNDKRFSD